LLHRFFQQRQFAVGDGCVRSCRHQNINERNPNVVENKGPMLETCSQSRNVYENKTI